MDASGRLRAVLRCRAFYILLAAVTCLLVVHFTPLREYVGNLRVLRDDMNEAGLWAADSFIEIPDDAFGVQASEPAPSGPQDWVAGLGG